MSVIRLNRPFIFPEDYRQHDFLIGVIVYPFTHLPTLEHPTPSSPHAQRTSLSFWGSSFSLSASSDRGESIGRYKFPDPGRYWHSSTSHPRHMAAPTNLQPSHQSIPAQSPPYHKSLHTPINKPQAPPNSPLSLCQRGFPRE